MYVSADAKTWTPHHANGDTNYGLSSMRGYDQALAVTSFFDCCFGEVPSSIKYGRATSFDGVSWAFVDGPQFSSLPEFVTDGGCVSMEPTTFPNPAGGTMQCSSIGAAVTPQVS